MNKPIEKIYIAVPVWGASYIDTYIKLSLPSQLADGNLPSVSQTYQVIYNIYSSQKDKSLLQSSPHYQRLSKIVQLNHHIITDPLVEAESGIPQSANYDIKTKCYMHILGEAFQSDAPVFLLNADIIFGNGFFAAGLRRIAEGYRTVELPGPRTSLPAMAADISRHFTTQETGVISVPNEILAGLAVKHLHPSLDAHFWEKSEKDGLHPSHLYWRLNDTNILARCFHLYPILIRPRYNPSTIGSTIDRDLVVSVCPDYSDAYVVMDSTEMFCCELSSPHVKTHSLAKRGDYSSLALFFAKYGEVRGFFLQQHAIRIGGGKFDKDQWKTLVSKSDATLTEARRVYKLEYPSEQRNKALPFSRGSSSSQQQPTSAPRRKFCCLLAVWGLPYAKLFLDRALYSLMAWGNLPYLAENGDAEFIVLTRREDYDTFQNHGIFLKLCQLMKVSFLPIDDLLGRTGYGASLTFAFARGIMSRETEMTNTHFIFLNADFLFSADSFRNMIKHIDAGYSAILAPSFRCEKEPFLDFSALQIGGETQYEKTGRELVQIALDHIHRTFAARVVEPARNHSTAINQFLWKVDDKTYVGHFFLQFMLMIKPEVPLKSVVGYCDYTFVPLLCPSGNIKIVNDSDEIFILEMQGRDHEIEYIHPGPFPSIDFISDRLGEWTTKMHRIYGETPLIFHAADIPKDAEEVKQRAGLFIQEVSALLPEPAPYMHHPYWHGHLSACKVRVSDFKIFPVPMDSNLPAWYASKDSVEIETFDIVSEEDRIQVNTEVAKILTMVSSEATYENLLLENTGGGRPLQNEANVLTVNRSSARNRFATLIGRALGKFGYSLTRTHNIRNLEHLVDAANVSAEHHRAQMLRYRQFSAERASLAVNLEKNIKFLGEEVERVTADANAKISEITKLKSQLRRLQEKEQEAERLAIELAEARTELDLATERGIAADRAVAILQNEIDAARKDQQQKEALLQKILTDRAATALELQQMRATHEVAHIELRNEKAIQTHLRKELGARNVAFSEISAELQKLQSEYKTASAESEVRRQQLMDAQSELNRFRSSHNAAAEELEQERTRLSALQKQLNRALAHQEEAMAQASQWQITTHSLNTELASALHASNLAEKRALAAEKQALSMQRRATTGGKLLPIHWIASYPRSGNTWLRTLVSCLEFGVDCDLHNMQRMIPDLLDTYDPRWATDRRRLLAKSHFPPDQAEFQAAILEPASYTASSILIVRHPFDVAIACYDMMMLNTPGGAALAKGDTRENFNAYFEAFARSGGSKNGLLEGEGLGLTKFIEAWHKKIDKQGGLVLTYEALLSDPLEVLTRVAAALSIEADTAKLLATIQRCSFDRLRADEEADIASRRETNSEFFRSWREEAYKAGRRFFNVGRSGRWMSVLTPEQVELGVEHLRDAFELSGFRLPK
ncbi:sulfotransferase domain-containing protein [Ferrovibrio sp.]|uniref:sulfotransferase domain-containing protein n=1 Tax=Ferrovibrio sp. TaxID=1917215 RepID=UPI0035B4EB4D